MKRWMKAVLCISLSFMCLFTSVGYAALSRPLRLEGSAKVSPPLPDLYISSVTPTNSGGIQVLGTSGTVLTVKVSEGGSATLWITVTNTSDIVYVYERTIDGSEAGIDGVYSGTDITYELHYLLPMYDVPTNNGTRTFGVTITAPEGVSADCFLLNFKFVDRFTDIGGEFFPEEMPEEEVSLAQRLSDILNNRYRKINGKSSRDFLIDDTIQVRWDEWSPPYVGSMDVDYQSQIQELFGDVMKDTNLSFILKNQDLNGDWINEIALYSTTDYLDSTAAWGSDGVVCVYVTVFTPVIDTMWNIIGYEVVCEAVRGYCYEVRYDAENLTPSFSTDEWKVDVGYMERWDNETNAPVLMPIPDDTPSTDGTTLYKLDYNSYNLFYQGYKTAPYGKNLREWLDGRIPPLY